MKFRAMILCCLCVHCKWVHWRRPPSPQPQQQSPPPLEKPWASRYASTSASCYSFRSFSIHMKIIVVCKTEFLFLKNLIYRAGNDGFVGDHDEGQRESGVRDGRTAVGGAHKVVLQETRPHSEVLIRRQSVRHRWVGFVLAGINFAVIRVQTVVKVELLISR